MKKWIFLFFLIPAIVLSYNRIISLAPSITETLFFVGAGKQVVGVSRFCKFPKEALSKEKIGGYLDINYEKIIDLSPDLVLCLDSSKTVQNKLSSLNIPVSVITQTTLQQIKQSILKIGQLTGHSKLAKEKIKKIEQKIRKPKSNKNISILLIVGRSKGDLSNIYVAGNTGFYDEIIHLTGASNAFRSKLKIAYPIINTESLISLNPDIIIELIDSRGTQQTIKKKKQDWNSLPFLKAVKNKHIYYIKKDYSTIPGPRIFNLIQDMNDILQHIK